MATGNRGLGPRLGGVCIVTAERSTSRQRGPFSSAIALGAAVALIAGALVVALLAGRNDDTASPTSDSAAPAIVHVHGLGVNPADGSVIVATHTGSFRLAAGDGEPERIGDSFRDTMGFTVAGPDHFLGSGHPDVAGLQAGDPTSLGLIESTDGGWTWETRSLGGEVDFHGLAFAHDRVYGWDSSTGRFMVSADKREWDTRGTLDLFAFAVSPDDPDRIVGTGPDGLVQSTDGGRNWEDAEGPPTVALSWDAEAGLWVVADDGAVWRREGTEWERTGDVPGQPHAFVATADRLYAAAADPGGRTTIYESPDGRTWDLRYRDPAQ